MELVLMGKNKLKKAKEFDAVESFRKIKEQISFEIADMSFEELKAYFSKNSITKESK